MGLEKILKEKEAQSHSQTKTPTTERRMDEYYHDQLKVEVIQMLVLLRGLIGMIYNFQETNERNAYHETSKHILMILLQTEYDLMAQIHTKQSEDPEKKTIAKNWNVNLLKFEKNPSTLVENKPKPKLPKLNLPISKMLNFETQPEPKPEHEPEPENNSEPLFKPVKP